MSYTINGIGTHIYGRDRELTREDQCEQCGNYSVLSSYDATNYFVVVFIPIIPLGKLRVLDHCGSCQRWRQMPLKQWETVKEDAVRASLDAMRQNPSDPEAVKTALVTATQFQDEGMLLKFKQVADNFSADAEVQGLLGATLSYFGRNQEAIGAYEAAVAANHEDESLKEQLAVEYALAGEPEKAERQLSHIWSAEKPDKIAFAMELVRGYQAKGDHQTAIAKLDKVAELHPSIAEDREFKRIAKEAKKYESKGTAVPQMSKSNTRYKDSSSSSSIAKWIFPAILAAGVLWFLVASFLAATNREVVLVNGLEQAYTATINGTEYELRPKQIERVKVGEGTVTIGANINGVEIPEETGKVKTPFFARLGSKKLFVINPDRTALITKAEVIYSGRGRDNREPDYEQFVGDSFYAFDGIEYQFESPPRQIKMKSSRGTVVRDQVDLSEVHDLPEIEAITQLSLILQPEDFLDYVRRKIDYGSRSQVLLSVFADRADSAEVLQMLEPLLEQSPVDLEVHRTYQQTMESSQPEHDLEKEYTERLAKNPASSDLTYLLARVTMDGQKRKALLTRAANATPPCAHALAGLAFDAVSNAIPRLGLEPSRKSLEMEPNNVGFTRTRAQVLEACGNYSEAMKLNHQMVTAGSSIGRIQQLGMDIPLLVAAGQGRKAEKGIDDLLREIRSQGFPDAVIESMETGLRGNLAYAEGNLAKLMNLKTTAGPEGVPITLHLAMNEVDEASEKLLALEGDPSDAKLDLSIYLAAKMRNKRAIAEKHLARAVEQLNQGDRDQRMIGAALAPGGVSSPQELKGIAAWPEDKRVFMAALAVRFPEDFDEYAPFAKKLNHKRDSPYLLIKKLRRPQ